MGVCRFGWLLLTWFACLFSIKGECFYATMLGVCFYSLACLFGFSLLLLFVDLLDCWVLLFWIGLGGTFGLFLVIVVLFVWCWVSLLVVCYVNSVVIMQFCTCYCWFFVIWVVVVLYCGVVVLLIYCCVWICLVVLVVGFVGFDFTLFIVFMFSCLSVIYCLIV